MKKLFKKIKNKKGVTLVELVIAMSLIIIFLLTVTLLMASSTTTYKKSLEMNYAKSIIDNVSNDIKNYITYGENIKLFDYVQDTAGNYIENYGEIINDTVNPITTNKFNGINLGFSKICTTKDDKNRYYIKGLSYTPEYYRGFEPVITITKEFKDQNNDNKWNENEHIIYKVNITLKRKDISSSFNFEVEQLNQSEFGYYQNSEK